MSENVSPIIEYYQKYNEDIRMDNNPLEYLRCKEIISRYLMKDHMDILDVGGATGVFSFWLAEKGHNVSLIDFAPKHIEIARQREKEKSIKLSSVVVGDARHLPFDDDSYDLVLLMGPLYHLTEKAERIKSIKEAYRVLRPNGRMIGETISRFASMIDGFLFNLVEDKEFVSIMNEDIKTGFHKDTSSSQKYFTNAYFHRTDELESEFEESGFIIEDVIPVTSFGCTIPDINKRLQDEQYKNTLLETIKLVEKEPSLTGISSHHMVIGKKNLV